MYINAHPIAGILVDPFESEVLETTYLLSDLSKLEGHVPLCPYWVRPLTTRTILMSVNLTSTFSIEMR